MIVVFCKKSSKKSFSFKFMCNSFNLLIISGLYSYTENDKKSPMKIL